MLVCYDHNLINKPGSKDVAILGVDSSNCAQFCDSFVGSQVGHHARHGQELHLGFDVIDTQSENILAGLVTHS